MLNLFSRTREARKNLEQQRARLYRVAFAWCRNAALADDLVQDTLTKAMRKAGQLRDQKAGEAWLFSILNNCFRDHFRRQRETEDIDNVTLLAESTPEIDRGRKESVERVRDAIATLSDGQRQVVTLVDLEGISYAEVAAILDIPTGTVMSRLCRARNSLRQVLLVDMQQDEQTTPRLRRVK